MRLKTLASTRKLAAAATVAALALCGQARAQVLEQVPADAAAVFRINNLGALNTKIAKMAKTFGLDEINPDMKDPLTSMLDKGHMSKGVDRSGDAALAVFAPDEKKRAAQNADGAKDEPEVVALVPVSDYDAFVGNYQKSGDGAGGITAVKDPEDASKTMYIVHRGKYAVLADQKGHLAGGAMGFKVIGAAAKEVESKDAVFLLNVPAIRAKALPELKNNRKKIIADMNTELEKNPQFKDFIPVFNTVANEGLDFAQNFLADAQSIGFTLNLTDEGLALGGLVEFSPGSKMGQSVSTLKAGNTPLLAGLPDRKYFAFGGFACDPKAASQIVDQYIDPVIADLNKSDNKNGKQIADALGTMKTVFASMTHSAIGYLVPSKALGQESIVQQVGVTNGDAKAITAAEKKLLSQMNDLMALLPNQGAKTKFDFSGAPKTIDGVELQSFATKMEMDENDPRAAQMQQFMAMLYGPNGMNGNYGAVNDKTFIVTQGLSDDLLKDAVDAAKSGKDVLSESAGVKAVASQLPKDRQMEYYVALDNIVTSALKYAQGFGFPVKVKLPQNLPPLGFSGGAEGTMIRLDGFVPAQTVQSLVAAGIQGYTQMQNGGAGGGL